MARIIENITESETTSEFLILLSTNVVSYKPFSDQLAYVVQWLTFSLLNQAICIFGIGSNIINIICFVKQGFKDPVNVSLLGLAVADIGSLTPLMWTNLCFNPEFVAADLPFQPIEFQFLISAMPHTTFTRITSCITALITVERCLCISAPMKVKTIVTSKRVTIIIICVFFVLIADSAPIYVANRLAWKFCPEKNKTCIRMISVGNKEAFEKVLYVINNVCLPFGAFFIIIICTIIIVIKLHIKTKWRKQSTCSAQADTISVRNQKVSKMVVTISILFISCFTPVCILFIVMSLDPEVSVVGKNVNAVSILGGIGTFLESINSSVNIFIYYHMSSKYKVTIRQLFYLEAKN